MKGRKADHRNNVKSMKNNIERTKQNVEFANELAAETADKNIRNEMKAENRRREEAVEQLDREVRDNAKHHKP